MSWQEIDGVMWCLSHHGVVDECADRIDADGELRCDNSDPDPDEPCHAVPVFYEVQP